MGRVRIPRKAHMEPETSQSQLLADVQENRTMVSLWKFQCLICKVTIGPSEATETRFGLCGMCEGEGKTLEALRAG